MLGSLLGDIVGSRFEFMSTQEKDVQIFHSSCSWTDDSLLTYAVSKVCHQIKHAGIDDPRIIEALFCSAFKKMVKDYPMAGWGKSFYAWAHNSEYYMGQSAANGCLMRVAPIIMYFDDLDKIQQIGKLCTQVSHHHPESFKMVEIYLEVLHFLKSQTKPAKNDISASDIKEIEIQANIVPSERPITTPTIPLLESDKIIELKVQVKAILAKHGLELKTVEQYHQEAGYWVMAKDTLPRALAAYLEGTSFETIMKNMLYIGSDTDTTATIAGALAELTYSLDAHTLNQFYRYYDFKSFNILKQVCSAYVEPHNEEFFQHFFDHEAQAKIKELLAHQAVDPTAQWDPLEVPSDDEYYKLKPGFSLRRLFIKIFRKDMV